MSAIQKYKNAAPFWKVFFVILALLIVASIIVWIVLWNYLVAYQNSRAVNAMDIIVSELNKGDYSAIVQNSAAGELDEEEQKNFTDKLKDLVDDNRIVYEKAFSKDNDLNPAFTLRYNKNRFCKIILEPSKNDVGFGMQTYKIKQVMDIPFMDASVKITAPSDYAVYVNGKCISDSEIFIKEKRIVPDEVKNVPGDYLKKPSVTIYDVTDLFEVNSVTATMPDGTEARVISEDEDGEKRKVLFGNPSSPDQYYQVALSKAKIYAQFVTGWVGQGTVLSNVLPGISLRDDLAGIQTGFYTDHKKDYFINEKTSNLQIFADNCFSCDVSFVQIIEDIKTNHNFKKELPAAYNFTFVQKDGTWYIADLALR